jgi:hypothetical protein
MVVVESAWGAVPMLASARFPRPLAEPVVRVSRLCRIPIWGYVTTVRDEW